MWPNPKFAADLVTFTEEILNRKLHFLCAVELIIPGNYRASIDLNDTFNSVSVYENHQPYLTFFGEKY